MVRVYDEEATLSLNSITSSLILSCDSSCASLPHYEDLTHFQNQKYTQNCLQNKVYENTYSFVKLHRYHPPSTVGCKKKRETKIFLM
jgi:hypothetical protein